MEEDGLGFDFKWNKGFSDCLIEYMQLDPIFRGPHHAELIFSMVYNYSENFMLALDFEQGSGPEEDEACQSEGDVWIYDAAPGQEAVRDGM